ncbi:MAG: hypothetical protein ACI8PZ_006867 [Myxococcota bacterium]|jgi:hypothetical protein
MSLSAQERAEVIEMLPALAREGDAAPVVDLFRSLAGRMLAELGQVPGFDAVRAGAMRVAPHLDGGHTVGWLEAVSTALERYAEEVGAGDPTVLLSRHPAWAGLARLELGLARADAPEDAIAAAEALARVGFTSVDDGRGTQRGTVLWALSEKADEVGWTDRAAALLAAAEHGPFDDDSDLARIKLLRGLSAAEDGDAGAEALLLAAAEDDDADSRTQTHARWVLSALARDSGNTIAAAAWLDRAIAGADDEPDEVLEQLRKARATLG